MPRVERPLSPSCPCFCLALSSVALMRARCRSGARLPCQAHERPPIARLLSALGRQPPRRARRAPTRPRRRRADAARRRLGRQGDAAATAAWKKLAAADAAALPDLLAAMDGANDHAQNRLRAVVEAIAQREAAAGRRAKPADLEAFLLDTRHHPRARRMAFVMLAQAGPARSCPASSATLRPSCAAGHENVLDCAGSGPHRRLGCAPGGVFAFGCASGGRIRRCRSESRKSWSPPNASRVALLPKPPSARRPA